MLLIVHVPAIGYGIDLVWHIENHIGLLERTGSESEAAINKKASELENFGSVN